MTRLATPSPPGGPPMSVTTWFRNRVSRPDRPTVGTAMVRPRLEMLEGRVLPSFGWAAAVGGEAIATDAAGNVYLAGSYFTSFTPAGSTVTLSSAGGRDTFVAKYSRSGSFQWATSLGGPQDDWGHTIAV